MKNLFVSLAMVLVVLFGITSVQAQEYTYKTVKGDTPETVAKKNGLDVSDVRKVFKAKSTKSKLRAGQVITVAKAEELKVDKPAAKKPVPADPNDPTLVALNSSAATEATPASSENDQADGSKKQTEVVAANVAPIQETGKEGESKDKSLNKFFEASGTFGGWATTGAADTRGVYGLVEGTGWIGNAKGSQNYGLGAVLVRDKGWGQNGIDWGANTVAIQEGFWQNFDDKHYLLIKARQGYRWNDVDFGDKPKSAFTLGGYAEFSRDMTFRDVGTIAADGWYFKNDSYVAVRVWWERMLSQDWKVKAGIGPVAHWQKDYSSVGVGPAVAVKYNDTVVVGVTVDTSKGGTYYGGFITVEYNSDIHSPFGKKSKK